MIIYVCVKIDDKICIECFWKKHKKPVTVVSLGGSWGLRESKLTFHFILLIFKPFTVNTYT